MGSDNIVVHNFIESSKIGNNFEIFLINDIRNKKYVTANKYISSDKDTLKYYDIIVTDNNNDLIFGIECKCDVESISTGNLFFEVGQWNHKGEFSNSGLNSTKSKYWLHGDGNKTYLLLTDKLRDIIKLFDEYRKEFAIIVNNDLLSGDDIDLKLNMLNNHYMSKIIGFNPVKNNIKYIDKKEIYQDNGYWKPMRYYLIKKELIELNCIEFGINGQLTYNNMI